MADLYVWISRWEDFQHYPPERDRAPAWLKTYTKQLDDDAYLQLTSKQRAALHDLRIAFARAHGQLSNDTRTLSHRIGQRVTNETLAALNQAGFIEFCSREGLDQRLDKFYSPRARPRARGEGEREGEEEKEKEKSQNPAAENPSQREPTTASSNGQPDEPEHLGQSFQELLDHYAAQQAAETP